MKKLLILIITLLLFGCTVSVNTNDLVYLSIDNEYINSIDVERPSKIEIYDPDISVLFTIDNEKDINKFVNIFKKMQVVNSVEDDVDDVNTKITLYFNDKKVPFTINYETIHFIDEDITLYSKDTDKIIEYLEKYFDAGDNLNDKYKTIEEIISSEMITIKYIDSSLDDNGDYIVNFDAENLLNIDKCFKVNCYVNDIPLYNSQAIVMLSNSNTKYSFKIPTSCLKQFGINKLADIKYNIDLYDYDINNYSVEDYNYSSDYYSFNCVDFPIGDRELVLGDSIYDGSNISVYGNIYKKDDLYNLALYISNVNHTDIHYSLDSLTIIKDDNSENVIIETDYQFDISKHNNGKVFYLPLNNYVINNNEYKYYEIKEVKLNLLNDNNENIIIDVFK